MYKVSHILEAQHKEEIGTDIIITVGDGVQPSDVVTIKVRSNLSNIEHYDNITALFERAVRQHIRNVNLSINQRKSKLKQ